MLRGSPTYFSVKPCINGHTSERRTNNKHCLECEYQYDKEKYKRNREKILADRKKKNATQEEKDRCKQYREKNKDYLIAWRKTYYKRTIEYQRLRTRLKYLKNKERILVNGAAWREVNRERHKEMQRAWLKANPDKSVAYANWRRAKILRATPPWANRIGIDKIYRQAKEIEKKDGVKRHVDHEIPLHHELVCGLHVEENLRIVTATENVRKGNRFNVVF